MGKAPPSLELHIHKPKSQKHFTPSAIYVYMAIKLLCFVMWTHGGWVYNYLFGGGVVYISRAYHIRG